MSKIYEALKSEPSAKRLGKNSFLFCDHRFDFNEKKELKEAEYYKDNKFKLIPNGTGFIFDFANADEALRFAKKAEILALEFYITVEEILRFAKGEVEYISGHSTFFILEPHRISISHIAPSEYDSLFCSVEVKNFPDGIEDLIEEVKEKVNKLAKRQSGATLMDRAIKIFDEISEVKIQSNPPQINIYKNESWTTIKFSEDREKIIDYSFEGMADFPVRYEKGRYVYNYYLDDEYLHSVVVEKLAEVTGSPFCAYLNLEHYEPANNYFKQIGSIVLDVHHPDRIKPSGPPHFYTTGENWQVLLNKVEDKINENADLFERFDDE